MKIKKKVLGVLAAAMLAVTLMAPLQAHANQVAWDGGTFTWSLVRLNNSTVQARVGFTRNIRLILIGETQDNLTGNRLAFSGTMEAFGTSHAINGNNLIAGRHAVFATHEARGTTSIARFTSMAF